MKISNISRASIAANLLSLTLLASFPASAETLDLSRIKCEEFLATSKEQIGYASAWLDAYYKDEDEPPVIDLDRFAANARKLVEFCTANPDARLMKASAQLFR